MDTPSHMDYVFGPVTSSRLGRSLGLDLLGQCVCTYDCLYCEVGPTETRTRERAPYAPADQVLTDLRAWAESDGSRLDHVTLGGRGEPCLNSDLAAIIEGCKRILPDTPVAVLTNSSLLTDPQVREELALADVALPSMDSLLPSEFKAVNRPHPDLKLDDIAQGLLDFRNQFSGRIYAEILLVTGINASDSNLDKLDAYLKKLAPERVDVTTMTRTGAYSRAKPVSAPVLDLWRERLGRHGRAAPPSGSAVIHPRRQTQQTEVQELVRRSLNRRPQNGDDLATSLALPRDAVDRALANLAEQGHIQRVRGLWTAFRAKE